LVIISVLLLLKHAFLNFFYVENVDEILSYKIPANSRIEFLFWQAFTKCLYEKYIY